LWILFLFNVCGIARYNRNQVLKKRIENEKKNKPIEYKTENFNFYARKGYFFKHKLMLRSSYTLSTTKQVKFWINFFFFLYWNHVLKGIIKSIFYERVFKISCVDYNVVYGVNFHANLNDSIRMILKTNHIWTDFLFYLLPNKIKNANIHWDLVELSNF
jgi:hypothetical protein